MVDDKKIEGHNKKPVNLADAYRIANEAARANVEHDESNPRKFLETAVALNRSKPTEAGETPRETRQASGTEPPQNSANTSLAKPNINGKPIVPQASNPLAASDGRAVVTPKQPNSQPAGAGTKANVHASVGTAHENLNVRTTAASNFALASKSPLTDLSAILKTGNLPKAPPTSKAEEGPKSKNVSATPTVLDANTAGVKGVVPPVNSDGVKAGPGTTDRGPRTTDQGLKKGERKTRKSEESSSGGAMQASRAQGSEGDNRLEAASSGIAGNGEGEIAGTGLLSIDYGVEGPGGKNLLTVLGNYSLYRRILQPLKISPQTIDVIASAEGFGKGNDLVDQAEKDRNAQLNSYGVLKG